MGTTLLRELPTAVQQLVKTDATLLAVLATLAIVALLVHFRDGRAIGTKARPDLHTVPGVPLLGNLLHLIARGDRHMEMFSALRREKPDNGKILSITIPGQRLIDITKPSARRIAGATQPPLIVPLPQWIEYVQKTNFSNFEKGPKFFENMSDVLGEGIFVVDGAQWNTQRKATSKIFSTNNFRGFITTAIVSEIDKLKIIIGRYADSGEEFDLAALFFRFTLESFAVMAFGSSIGALSLETDEPVPFASAFDYAQGVMNCRFTNPLWKVTELFTGEKTRMKAASKVMDDFAFKIISQREKEGLGNITRDDKQDSTDLLSLYMALRDENGKPLSKRALRDSVMNLIIAGRDTTAQGLAWTWFHLLTKPELIAPMRAEIDKVDRVDFDSYKELVETQAVFHEGLRLHPSVPKNAWGVIKDDHIPDGGPKLQAGDRVHWCDWELGRFTDVWGDDAAQFKPTRWIDEKKELKKESQWKAHFFNGGARLCLGQTLAIYEATSVMAAIIRDFDLCLAPSYLATVEMVDCEQTPRYANSLTLPMQAPLRVTATRRKGGKPGTA